MTAPITKIKTKNKNENVNPLMESTTSLPCDCGSFSNSFIHIPPMSTVSINHFYK